MTAAVFCHRRPCFAPFLAAASLLLVGACAAAEVAALQPTADRVEATDECRRCHFRRPEEAGSFAAQDGFCTQAEAATWEKEDKHRQAFLLLTTEKNRPLVDQILGFPLSSVLSLPSGGPAAGIQQAVHYLPDADAQRLADVRQCLACHAPIAEPMTRGSAQLTLANGVSCQACHGPGRVYMTPHQDSTNVWRIVKADVKESLFGLRDLRHPVKRAALCASCHVGSFSDQWKTDEQSPPRFIKHRWYAQGHPPLPGFEYVAFSQQMPMHWRPLPEKLAGGKFAWYDATPEGKELEAEIARFIDTLPRSVTIDRSAFAANYREANAGSFSELPAADMFRSKDVLVSGLGVLSSYASLLADAPDELRTDFSLFDCGACHHELRSRFPSEARVRRRLPPGRLPPAYWTLALARQGARRSSRSNDFDVALAELDLAFGARPFGDPAAVRAAAHKLEQTCGAIGNALAAEPLDQGDAAAILSSLAHPQHDEDRDYHAARQQAWAIREVLADLAGIPLHRRTAAEGESQRPSAPLSPAVTAALGFETGQPIRSDDPRVRQRIDGLFGGDAWQGPLRLRLAAGQDDSIVDRLPQSLSAISSYDPAWFRERLQPIQAAFPGP